MNFEDFFIKHGIPYEKVYGEDIEEEYAIRCDDKLIIPYEEEFRRELPEAELAWDYLRYRNEPNRISG